VFNIQINGHDFDAFQIADTPGVWQKVTLMWESGDYDYADLSIITPRNDPINRDFALDDISFKLHCALKTNPATDTSICIGNSTTIRTITLDGLPPFTYSWTDNFGNSFPQNSNEITVSPTVTTSYFVHTVDANKCENIDQINVNILPLPVITIATDKSAKLCDKETITLTADGGTAYSWSTGETTPSIQVKQSGTYRVTVTNANGCVNWAEQSVEFVPLPVPVITANKPTDICPCEKITLTANPGYSYLWSTGETTQSIETGTAGKYSVTLTDQLGCTASTDMEVTIKHVAEKLKIDTLVSRVNEQISLPLRRIEEANIKTCGFSQFTARIRFNKSLMIPLNEGLKSTFEGDDQIIELSGSSLEDILAEFKFLVVLGNAECTDIKLEHFSLSCGDVTIENTDGRMCLTGICTDPTARLISDTGILYLSSPMPNPAGGMIEFSIGLIENGRSELSIINSFGEEVAKVFDKDFSAGVYPARFDTSNLPQGTYFCILKTPTQSAVQRMEVVK
jgi:hypothetical protein